MGLKRGATIVVLGGGLGGVAAVRALRREVSPEDRVVLVERSDGLTFNATSFWILTGARRPADLTRPYATLARHSVEVYQQEVTGLDPQAGIVQTTGGGLGYDYAIVALGAELRMDAIPGLAEAGYNLYQAADLVRLRGTLESFAGGRVAVVISRLPFKCPAAPYEAALQLDSVLRSRGLRADSSIDVYTPEPMPIAVAGPESSERLVSFLRSRDIAIHTDRKLEGVDPNARRLSFQDGSPVPYDLLAAVPVHVPPAPIRDGPIAGEGGWVPVDRETFATSANRVYAVGDVTSVRLPSGGPLPKAGVFAQGAAEAVAHNIAVRLRGRGQERPYAASGGCHIETADGRAFVVEGDFYAMPRPQVDLKGPTRRFHWAKIYFERSVLNMLS